jgi:hypothetical protein
MTADEIIDNIKTVADLQYANEPAQDRLAYHVGLLQGHLRRYIYTTETAQAYIKELETKLIAKDSE